MLAHKDRVRSTDDFDANKVIQRASVFNQKMSQACTDKGIHNRGIVADDENIINVNEKVEGDSAF